MSATVTSNASEFNAALRAYVALWTRKGGRSVEDALSRQGQRLSWDIANRLKGIAPEKGSIRAERMAAFKQGIGIKIRKSKLGTVYGGGNLDMQSVTQNRIAGVGKNKRYGKQFDRLSDELGHRGLAFQAMLADLEIRYREKARGFLAFAARFSGKIPALARITSKQTGATVAEAAVKAEGNAHAFTITWSPALSKLSGSAGEGLSKPKAQEAINSAFADRTADMMTYLESRMAKEWAKA